MSSPPRSRQRGVEGVREASPSGPLRIRPRTPPWRRSYSRSRSFANAPWPRAGTAGRGGRLLSPAYQVRHVFGAGPAAPFVGGPMEQTRPRASAPDVQDADAFGGVQLVSRHGEKIHLQRLHVHGDLAHALGRVGVEGHTRFPGNLANLPNGRQRPGLIVGVHDADQDGVRGQCPAYLIRVYSPGAVHRQDGEAKPLRLKIPARRQHRRMLRGTGDDTPAAVMGGHAFDNGIVGLRRAAGEDDLRGGANPVRPQPPAGPGAPPPGP